MSEQIIRHFPEAFTYETWVHGDVQSLRGGMEPSRCVRYRHGKTLGFSPRSWPLTQDLSNTLCHVGMWMCYRVEIDFLVRSTLHSHQHSAVAETTTETHLTDAVIFGSRTTRCAVTSMILTELAASMLTCLMGSQVSAFFENLEGRFDGSERLVVAKAYSRGLMQ
jgi:hypothetical protein